jgi:hypothetical protein
MAESACDETNAVDQVARAPIGDERSWPVDSELE